MKAKMKLKLDGAAIKGFFIEHGEKIVVGLAVLLLMLFAASIFQRELLPDNLSPKAIEEKSTQAMAAVNNSKVDSIPPAERVTHADVRDKVVVKPLPLDTLAFRSIVDKPIGDLHKRTEPKYYPVVDLQAYAMFGPMVVPASGAPNTNNQQLINNPRPAPQPIVPPNNNRTPPNRRSGPNVGPGAGNRNAGAGGVPGGAVPGGAPGVGVPNVVSVAQGQPGAPPTGAAESREFVVVTGAIPELQQRKEYEACFNNTQKMDDDPASAGARRQQDADDPQYLWWVLERTDLNDPKAPPTVIGCGDFDTVLGDIAAKSIAKEEAVSTLHAASAKKLLQDITKWGGLGNDVVDPQYKGANGAIWMTWPLPPIALHDWGREATNPKIPQSEQVAAQAATTAPDDAGAKPADVFDGAPTGAGNRGVPGPRVPLGAVNGPAGVMREDAAAKADIPYKLFRFVDFDIQPGHNYSYRVKLVLRNPNFGRDPQVLAKPDLAAGPYRLTDWSDKTKPVALGPDSRVLASNILKVSHGGGEPKIKASVLAWDSAQAMNALDTFEMQLGDIANFGAVTLKDAVNPAKKQALDKDTTFNLLANAAVVDVRGTPINDDKSPGAHPTGQPIMIDPRGNPVTDGIAEPPELLLVSLDATGKPTKMSVVNEAEDKPVVDEWEKYHKQAADAGANSGFGPTPSGNNGNAAGPLFGPQKDDKTTKKAPTPKAPNR